MKPTGPIPPDFRRQDGALMIGGRSADDWIGIAGDTPLFVYDLAIVRDRIARFRAAFPGVSLHYAVKANPHPPLVAAIASLVDGIDVASAGEAKLALDAGMDARRISFAGPGKRDRELEMAIEAGVTLNLESDGEADRALAIGRGIGRTPRLALRINPDFELKGSGMKMGGGAKPFGVDADRAAPIVRRIVEAGAVYRGLHIFAGSQALDAEALIEAQRSALALAARVSGEAGIAPPHVNLGGGFGIPYFANDAALDENRVGIALSAALAARDPILADAEFTIELGRWLVGEAGVYLTRIVDRKASHGETFLVVDGGLHHQLAASGNFGTVVRRNYPISLTKYADSAIVEDVTVVGCLCTPIDRLGDHVGLPEAKVGDVVALFLAGAYGASASPQAFLGHPPSREITIDGTRIL
ncbi:MULTISPECIES: pyridoxal-dependent decarboxylase, exosortase A system-associated [unclassified Sphingomonas]|uniref:pyridoxal-dependent decarboxylase, exosortase A system-associated n=1 Tax=unclassified Sphingomonas TaxID=196159 RepID=UPI0006F57E13|nr:MULTISPECIES: pyridoxal-dependent decarboxylase, exosortase A system-associated [unclassified Sphingomonas]KQX22727.1 diaminopimelate decarboxylase [Sphingomonas sp. Root1294]KQY67793.1 diaminopimelate decarboxylase [Sphingomonas sp. Root50]KRB88718.1 diaminopimelate decarboxylase [Sphingomonas sp. Root720]